MRKIAPIALLTLCVGLTLMISGLVPAQTDPVNVDAPLFLTKTKVTNLMQASYSIGLIDNRIQTLTNELKDLEQQRENITKSIQKLMAADEPTTGPTPVIQDTPTTVSAPVK